MILCIQFGWDPDSKYDQVESTKGNISDARDSLGCLLEGSLQDPQCVINIRAHHAIRCERS